MQARTKDEMNRIKDIWLRASTCRKRYAIYEYLAAVYDLYALLRRFRRARGVTEDIRGETEPRAKFRKHPIRIIIDATCDADRKAKSKWTLALRYAWRCRSRWSKLPEFFGRTYGIAGCASRFTQVRPSRKRTKFYYGPGVRPLTEDQRRRLTVAVKLQTEKIPHPLRKAAAPIGSYRLSARMRRFEGGLNRKR
jgi:hypothetical protein